MSNMARILAAAQKAKSNSSGDREEQYFYYPATDVSGNGSAVIRFLPGIEEEIPFVKYYSHGFKGAATGKWLIDNCPTSIEEPCPVCEANSQLYNSLTKEEARKYGMNRKTHFVSRILVVEDKKNPENEGNVFLYKYGTKIFGKIMDAMAPAFDDDAPIEVFDLKKGANFKLKIRKVDGQTNYDKSEFDAPSICKFNKDYSEDLNIQKFIARDSYKDFDTLKKRLDMVMGNTTRVKPEVRDDDAEIKDDDGFSARPPKSQSSRKEVSKSDDDEDDVMNMMKKLVEEDDDIPF